RLSHLAVDVSDHAVFETALKDALELEEEVHGLVNCAGIARLDPLLEMSSESFDTHIDTNLGGPFVATKVVGNAMKDRGIKGSIVNMSSQASSIALPRHTGYCCSKAGLDMLTKMTALELGPYGIRCNSVCPTVVMTPMGLRVWGVEDKAKPMRDRIPLGRFAEMSEVTSAVLYLLSDASSMTTGVVSVDSEVLSRLTAGGDKILTRQMLQLRCRSDRLDMITKLNLWGSDLGDVSVIGEALPALEVCSLSVNRIRTLSGFKGCNSLRELYLRKNAVSDVEEVEHLRRHCRCLE
ncbi:conserved hypothetical protein, partial [Perkinsus marinus ATCC 50983]